MDGTALIAFDDATVASYGPVRGVAIRAVLEELRAAGVFRSRVTLLCASALHRQLRAAELAALLGPDLVRKFGPRLLCHDAEDPAALTDLGRTPEHGYPVEDPDRAGGRAGRGRPGVDRRRRLPTGAECGIPVVTGSAPGEEQGWRAI